MVKNLNEDSYWLCYIKNGSNIIAGIYAIIAGDITGFEGVSGKEKENT